MGEVGLDRKSCGDPMPLEVVLVLADGAIALAVSLRSPDGAASAVDLDEKNPVIDAKNPLSLELLAESFACRRADRTPVPVTVPSVPRISTV